MRRQYRKKRKKHSYLFTFITYLIMYYTFFFFGLEKALAVALIMMVGLFLYKRTGKLRARSKYLRSGMKEVDTMSGTQFESFLLAHFEKLGYKGNTTQATNDFGADLVLKKDGEIIVIQAKRHKGKIGIKAVQEVSGAINFYGATKGIVVTNSYFTPAADKLAEAAKIELWDRKKLSAIMKSHKKETLNSVTQFELSDDNQIIKPMICPRCQSELLERSGKYGCFLGCSNFPECGYTQSI